MRKSNKHSRGSWGKRVPVNPSSGEGAIGLERSPSSVCSPPGRVLSDPRGVTGGGGIPRDRAPRETPGGVSHRAKGAADGSGPDAGFVQGTKRDLGEQRTTTEFFDQYSGPLGCKKVKLEPKTSNIEVISRNPAGPQELPTPQGPPTTYTPH